MRTSIAWKTMVRRGIRSAAVITFAAAAACSDPTDLATGSIRGTVVDNTGANVAYAEIELAGAAQVSRMTSTGADGVYTFTNLQPGAYALTVTPPNGFALGAAATTSVTVTSGTQADASAFLLERKTPEPAFAAQMDAYFKAATATQAFSGAALVIRNGQTLFEGAYGLADRELAIKNTLDTKFRVGSMNKMLTAVAVLQLVQAGKVSLDAVFGTYIPGYPNADMASKVTIHHLLTHTGGTGDIFGPQFTANRLQLREPADYLQLYGTRALQFAPGSQWEYSNYGFMLLGAVIEHVTGMRYDDYIAANVLGPAGMTETGALPEDVVVPGRSIGYIKQSGALVSNASTLPYRGTPAGGWYSTVGDIARFATALREHRLLDATHTTLLLAGKVVMGQSTVKYAYGFIDRIQGGRRLVGHGGGAPGMSGELSFEPNGGYISVILSNFDPPAAASVESFLLSNLPN